MLHYPLSRLASSTDRSRPLSSPPPPHVASRRVVPRPRLSRLRCRSEGTAASPHPSPSRRRRGKIPSIVVVLRSDTTLRVARLPCLVAPSNICSRSRQRDNIAAPAIDAAPRKTSILAKNAAAVLLLARGTSFPTAVVADAVPPPTPAPCHTPAPPNNMLIFTSLLKPDAAALLHHVRRPTPATALTPRQYHWRHRPRRNGSVDRVALVLSLSAGHPRRTGVCCTGVILIRACLGSKYYFLLFVW